MYKVEFLQTNITCRACNGGKCKYCKFTGFYHQTVHIPVKNAPTLKEKFINFFMQIKLNIDVTPSG
ncbi:MAG TPA: hypothetical protein ENL09_06580 [Bacteroidetes bacterium]|nr:hypothetical protein [Bacteroidota bacterium]